MTVSNSAINAIFRESKKEVTIFKNGKNIVLYSILADCVKHTSDEFWKSLFKDLSMGKCPKSLYISNGTIYSANKKKGFSYTIPIDDINSSSKKVFTELKELIVNNTSICSSIDISKKKAELQKRKSNVITNDTTWSDIRKKNVRELLIINYVIRMKEKYKLNWDSARYLHILIQLSQLSSGDVVFRNKKIESIKGIIYDEKKGMFRSEKTDEKDEKTQKEENTEDNYLYYYWDRYLTSTLKKI